MAWACPGCKRKNEDFMKKCSCGYAYYDILGVKPDAPPETVEQTYKYLARVWDPSEKGTDAAARAKSEARLKKINEAYALFRHFSPAAKITREKPKPIAVIILVVFGLICIGGATAFFMWNSSGKSPDMSSTSAKQAPRQDAATKNVAAPESPSQPQGQPQQDSSSAMQKSPSGAPAVQGDKTPEWAIDTVRKARFAGTSLSVDEHLSKWTAENSAKYSKVIGWQSKKMDDKIYLVSYTLSDGLATTGFYFDINTESGAIRNLQDHPDLQKKYGIQYGQ